MTAVKDILNAALAIAPKELAEEWDNVGLLAGSLDAQVDTALLALDLTPQVLCEAQECGAQLIVTHHPILFHARKNLTEDDPEGKLLCALVRSNMALIALHTNLDNASRGVNDALAAALALTDVQKLENGLHIGYYHGNDILRDTETALETRCRVYGKLENCKKAAVCGGAGSDFWPLARENGADVYITGEVRHHHALEAASVGLALLEAGHFETERVVLKPLAEMLKQAMEKENRNVRFLVSGARPF